jgi:hypothetical protein
MPPKKDDKKKGGQAVVSAGGTPIFTITEDELTEAETLPELNDFIFTNIFAFKKVRNQTRLKK